jgi:hypothetical protein
MSAADVFLHPTKGIEETASNVVLEAMAHGLPVIASDWSALAELVVHGEDGFLVDAWTTAPTSDLRQGFGARFFAPYNGDVERHVACDAPQLLRHILRMAGDRDLRRRLGDSARRRVEAHHSIERAARARVAFFDQLAAAAAAAWRGPAGRFRPLVDVDLVTRGLGSRRLEPAHRVALADAGARALIPELADSELGRELTSVTLTALGDGPASAADLLERCRHAVDCDDGDLWSFYAMLLLRLASYRVIEIAA